MNILITGGTGLIGQALCKALLARGDALTVLSRNPASVAAKCGPSVKAIGALADWQVAGTDHDLRDLRIRKSTYGHLHIGMACYDSARRVRFV